MAKLGYVGRVSPDGDVNKYRIAHTLFGTCSTGANESTKQIDLLVGADEQSPGLCDEWLVDGLTLTVHFVNANTVRGNVFILIKNPSSGQPGHVSNGTFSQHRIASVGTESAHMYWSAHSTITLTYHSNYWYISGTPGNLVKQESIHSSGMFPVLLQNRDISQDGDITAITRYSASVGVDPASGILKANGLQIPEDIAWHTVTFRPGEVQIGSFNWTYDKWPKDGADYILPVIHWASVGPITVVTSDFAQKATYNHNNDQFTIAMSGSTPERFDYDIPYTAGLSLPTIHGEATAVYRPLSDSDVTNPTASGQPTYFKDYAPPIPRTRWVDQAAQHPGVIACRIPFTTDANVPVKIFAKYRRGNADPTLLSGENEYTYQGQLELYAGNAGAKQPFTFSYISYQE